MPKSETLTLPCAQHAPDMLEIAPDIELPEHLWLILRNEDSSRAGHALDKNTARELFNYLGVWLHTF